MSSSYFSIVKTCGCSKQYEFPLTVNVPLKTYISPGLSDFARYAILNHVAKIT